MHTTETRRETFDRAETKGLRIIDDNKRIIEINGVKLEIDMRHAKTLDTFHVGDRVKVLIKEYSSSYASYPGVIVGFDEFKNLPTIIVAYVSDKYSDQGLKFLYLNSESKDCEICAANNYDLPFKKQDVLRTMDSAIEKARATATDLETRKALFLEQFGRYFEVEEAVEASAKAAEDALED